VFVAPRSGPALRGANVCAAVRLPSRREMPVCYFTAVLRHHRFRAAWSAGMGIVGWQAATKFAGCQFGPCGIRRERQPNNSLKRTVQSLRDWSCRLTQTLGHMFTITDLRTFKEALSAAADGPFFPDWEFSSLFGFEREEFRRLASEFNETSTVSDRQLIAISNACNNLLGYPHRKESVWSQWLDASPEELAAAYSRLKARRHVA